MADPIKIIVKPNQSGIIFTGTTQATTASNIGVGEGVYKQKVVNNLELKSLSGGTNVTITDLGDTLLFQSSGGSGGGTWGTITGTLSDQTDLQAALDTISGATDTNASDIATNVSGLATISGQTDTNTGNIGTNASNISGNAADIVTLSGETINKLDDVDAGANISIDKTDPLNPVISTIAISGTTDGVTSGATLAGNAVLSLERTIGLPDVTVDLSPLSGATAWGDITGTLSDQTDLQAELDTLNNGITGNTVDILSNAGNISLNAGNISDNADDIQLVSGVTTTNASGLATISGQTDTNTADIATNVSGLATISGQTDTNTADIATNVSGLATVSGATDTNTSDIVTLSGETINKVDGVVSGTEINVDNTDPLNPIINFTGASGGGVWGSITGTLSDQTDLQGELDNKADKNTTIVVKSTGYTLQESDNNKVIEVSGNNTITFPTGLTTGFQILINNVGTGTTTIASNGTLDVTGSPILSQQYAGATFYNAGGDNIKGFGNFGTADTAIWGSIAGTLSNQADLQAALDTISGATDTNTAAITGKTDLDLTILSVTGTTSLVQGDDGKMIEVTVTGATTLTMSSGVTTGWNVIINNVGGGVITIAAEGTLQSKASAVTLANQYGAGTVYHRGSNVFSLFGDLT